MSDQTPGATPRFFPYGSSCPACRYDLSHATATQCPECGTVLTERMGLGRLRGLTDEERAFGKRAIRRIGRWDVLRSAHTYVWKRYSVLGMAALGPPIIYGLWRYSQAQHKGYINGFLINGFAVGAAFSYGALLLVYAVLMAWILLGVNRRTRELHRRRDDDLARGIVEEWWAEASHRLTLQGAEPIGTYLRMVDGTIYGVRNDARAWVSDGFGVRVRLARLPTSGVAVGLRGEGPPATHVQRTEAKDLRPKPSEAVWVTPVVFFEKESQAFSGSAAFVSGG